MRKDIQIHINSGNVALSSIASITSYPFEWSEDEDFVYGVIVAPTTVLETQVVQNGICSIVSYIPKYKKMKIAVKFVNDESSFYFLQNPSSGDQWFSLYSNQQEVYASQLICFSKTNEVLFRFDLSKGSCNIYDANSYDLPIIKANKQNADMLLKCNPTNNYRYPLTGVGLTNWIYSNMDQYEFSKRLSDEFEDDGVSVINASYDFETNDLILDLDTTNVDKNG